jgi:hypothetical protein
MAMKTVIGFEKGSVKELMRLYKMVSLLAVQKVKATEEFKEVYGHWKVGEMTAVKAMEGLDVKKTTFYKLVKEYERDFKNNTK